MNKKIEIRLYQKDVHNDVAELLADFYHAMWRLKGRKQARNLESAIQDLSERIDRNETVFIAKVNDEIAGIQIATAEPSCKIECVYVSERFRRLGLAQRLLDAAESHFKVSGSDSFYVSVHPNNRAIIELLKSNGYDVLNLLEIRKRWPDERQYQAVNIMGQDYLYEMGDLIEKEALESKADEHE